MWTVTKAFLLACLQALVEHDVSSPFEGPLQTVYIGLYVPPTTPITADSVMADITEPTFTGYARQEVVWAPPFIDTRGPYQLQGGSLIWSPSDDAVADTITGVFMATLVTAGVLWMAQTLPGSGVVLSGPTTAFSLVPQFSLPFMQIYGGGAIVP